MVLDTESLRVSYQFVITKKKQLMDTFYGNLLKENPSLDPLFAHVDMKSQKKKLLQAIGMIIGAADQPGAMTKHLKELGRKLAKYGAKAKTPEKGYGDDRGTQKDCRFFKKFH